MVGEVLIDFIHYGHYGSNIDFWNSYRSFFERFTGHFAKMENLTVICDKKLRVVLQKMEILP